LDCRFFGAIPIIGTTISTTNVWEKIVEYVFENPIPTIDTSQIDLCLKANKTTMDMLKGIYAIKFMEDNPTFDSIGVFNDNNSARTYMAMSKKGVALYAHSANVKVDEEHMTALRVIVKKDILETALRGSTPVPESQTLHDDEPSSGDGGPVDEGYGDRMQTLEVDEELLKARYEHLSKEYEELKQRLVGAGSAEDVGRKNELEKELDLLKPYYDLIERRGGAFGKKRKQKVAKSMDKDIAYLRRL
jgi:hypothetical protein